MARKVVHEQQVLIKAGSWRSGVPGAVALISAVAFVTGVFDSGVREMLGEVLIGTLISTVLFGALAWWARKSLVHRLRLLRTDSGAALELDGPRARASLGSLRYAHGVFWEWIEAGVARRRVPVVWVQIEGEGSERITVRKALGVTHAVPEWPRAAPLELSSARTFSGEPVPLERALSRLEAARSEPISLPAA
jgi:hypothetical protein